MRRLLALAALFAAASLFRYGGTPGGTPDVTTTPDPTSPGGTPDPTGTTRPTSPTGSTAPVGGFNGAADAASTQLTTTAANTSSGNSAIDNMGHDFELGPDGNPIERGPDGFIIPREADAVGADDFLPNGSPVFHGETYTQIGSDTQTVNNANKITPIPDFHDIVVHGNPDGTISVDGNKVNPSQLAETINNNPNYDGGPVRMIVCHSGVSGAGQTISDLLGVEVQAPNNAVGTNRFLGPGQEPTVMDEAGWTTLFPQK